MSEENKKLDMQDLENIAGGNDGAFGPTDTIHNLASYDEHVVAHLPAGSGRPVGRKRRVCPGHQTQSDHSC